ncbi:MAG: coproporphyrinogen III oxidase [Rhodospirillales bacterium]|nr:coproporphyrinogen III oxidase [Rhodospirillales bacterium]
MNEIAIYVHWPFCSSKCPYCDFNSHVRETIDSDRWQRAYLAELDGFAAETVGRRVCSVFFGGGTPSLMDPGTTAAIVQRITSLWPVATNLEVTLEANPSTAEAARFRAFKDAGVNRLSVGVQALDDDALRLLGRGHSTAEARQAIALAAAIFPRFSFDMIWGWPGHTAPAWRQALTEAIAIAGDHLSAYQLTIEPGTAFWRDGVPAADEDTGCALHDVTQDLLKAAGLDAYEISNHARSGGECRHNLGIWRGGDYLGIGPGAHGRITTDGHTTATRAVRAPEKWLMRVEQGASGLAERAALTREERREELVMLGLRLREGLSRGQFRALTGIEPEAAVDANALTLLIEAGFAERDALGLRATAAGRLRLDAVLARLLA